MTAVAGLLLGFGPGGASAPAPAPAVPTLTAVVGGSGQVTFTIAGADLGTTNTLYVWSNLTDGWASQGSRTGDGTVVVTLANGRYFAHVVSTLSGQSTLSNVITLYITSGSGVIFAHSPADIIRRMIIDLGGATDPNAGSAWPCYWSQEPDMPDNCLTTYDTSGQFDASVIGGEVQEHYGVQVRARCAANNANTGYVKLNAIATLLDETAFQEVVTIGGSRYLVHQVNRKGGIFSLGKEKPNSSRHLFTLNVLVSLTRLNA